MTTTTVKTPSGWPVRLCVAAGLTSVEAPQGGRRKFSKVLVLPTCKVVITLFGTPALLVTCSVVPNP